MKKSKLKTEETKDQNQAGEKAVEEERKISHRLYCKQLESEIRTLRTCLSWRTIIVFPVILGLTMLGMMYYVSVTFPAIVGDSEFSLFYAFMAYGTFMGMFMVSAYSLDWHLKKHLSKIMDPDKIGSSAISSNPGQDSSKENAEENDKKKWREFLQNKWTSMGKRFDLLITVAGLVPTGTGSVLLPLVKDGMTALLLAILVGFAIMFLVLYLLQVVQGRRLTLILIELILRGELQSPGEIGRIHYFMFRWKVSSWGAFRDALSKRNRGAPSWNGSQA